MLVLLIGIFALFLICIVIRYDLNFDLFEVRNEEKKNL